MTEIFTIFLPNNYNVVILPVLRDGEESYTENTKIT